MKQLSFALLAVLLSACATPATVLCDHEGQGLKVLTSPPHDAEDLVAEIRRNYPAAIDAKRDHLVWLSSESGEIYLCTYRKHPARTGTCGATVHSFVHRGERLAPGYASISACH